MEASTLPRYRVPMIAVVSAVLGGLVMFLALRFEPAVKNRHERLKRATPFQSTRSQIFSDVDAKCAKVDPKVTTIAITYSIGDDGRVSRFTSHTPGPAADCIHGVLRDAQFPAGRHSVPLQRVYEF